MTPQQRTAALARAARLYAAIRRLQRQTEPEWLRSAVSLSQAADRVLLAIEALDAERDDEAREHITHAQDLAGPRLMEARCG